MKKRIIGICLVLVLLLALCACSAGSSKESDFGNPENQSAPDSNYYYDGEDTIRENSGESGAVAGDDGGSADIGSRYQTGERKIITTISFGLETKTFTETLDKLTALVASKGGYVESSDISSSETNSVRRAYFTFRIPTDAIKSASDEIEGLCNVTNKSESGEDVTLQYYDYQNRLASLRVEQERVTALLDKAVTMSEILEIEEQLTRLRTEIEELTTMVAQLDDLTDYSTIRVSLCEVETLSVQQGENFGDKLSASFTESMNFALSALKWICYAIVWLLPYLVVGAVIAIIVVACVRRGRKKHAQRIAGSQQESQPGQK